MGIISVLTGPVTYTCDSGSTAAPGPAPVPGSSAYSLHQARCPVLGQVASLPTEVPSSYEATGLCPPMVVVVAAVAAGGSF